MYLIGGKMNADDKRLLDTVQGLVDSGRKLHEKWIEGAIDIIKACEHKQRKERKER